MAELKPCPFCGGDKIELSIKTAKDDLVWYVSMFCKSCHCYGKRTRVTVQGDGWVSRRTIERSTEAREIAIEAWNRRYEEPKEIDFDYEAED